MKIKLNMIVADYDRNMRQPSNRWWRSLSTNEQKAFESKYDIIYRTAMPSEISAIHRMEVVYGDPIVK